MEKIKFEEHLEKFITCLKCLMIVTEPQETICCGTLYCQECTKYLTNCLKCRVAAKFRENSFIKRILNQMLIKCSFGCGVCYSYQELKNHMQVCDLRQFNCNICFTNEESYSSNKKELIKHMLESHEDEMIEINDKYSLIKKNLEKDSRAQSGLDKDYLYNLDEHYEYNQVDEYSYGDDEYPDYG
jgi:hypothetical protein